MAAVTNATPLMALDAVVIDTETTGLDPANARLLEIGAVRAAMKGPAEAMCDFWDAVPFPQPHL